MEFNLAGFFLVLSVVGNIIILVLLLIKKLRRLFEFFFLGLIAFSAGVSLSFFFSYHDTFFWDKFIYLSGILLIYFLLMFTLYFPYKIYFINRIANILLLLPVIILLILNFTNNLIVAELPNNKPIYSPYYPLFTLYALSYIIVSIGTLVYKFTKSNGLIKLQIRYLSIGVAFTAFFIIITNIILPLYGYHSLNSIGPSFTICLDISVFYVIFKHRLFNIRLIIGDFIYAILLSLYVNLVFFSVLLFEFSVFKSFFAPNVIGFDILISILFTITFLFINSKLALLRRVYTGIEGQNKALVNTRELILKKLDLQSTLEEIVQYIKKLINVDGINVIAKFNEEWYVYSHNKEFEHIVGREDTLLKLLSLPNKTYVTLEASDAQDFSYPYELYRDNGISMSLATEIDAQNKVVFFTHNEDIDSKVFTVEEIKFLSDLFNEVAMFINREYLHKKVVDFNETLQARIDTATKQLQEKNDALQNAYQEAQDTARQERDMLDIMGHELRTPATVVKMASYMLGSKVVDDYSKKQLDRIKDSIERQIRLINTFINTAKLDNNRLDLHISPIQLDELVRSSVEDNTADAINKGLMLEYKDNGPMPTLYADKAMIREVIDNFMTNSIKYTQKGKVQAYCSFDKAKNEVVVAVKDTGEGIKPEEVGQLFQKFKRLHNYTESSSNAQQIIRPGGTGLGLYVCKRVIELHKGRVWVDSEFGVGSTFYFALPVNSAPVSTDAVPHVESADMFKKLKLGS